MTNSEIQSKYLGLINLMDNSDKFPDVIEDCEREIEKLQAECNHDSKTSFVIKNIESKMCNYCGKKFLDAT